MQKMNIFRIMIASKGHILGYEDALNNRQHTSTAKCISSEAIVFKTDGAEFI